MQFCKWMLPTKTGKRKLNTTASTSKYNQRKGKLNLAMLGIRYVVKVRLSCIFFHHPSSIAFEDIYNVRLYLANSRFDMTSHSIPFVCIINFTFVGIAAMTAMCTNMYSLRILYINFVHKYWNSAPKTNLKMLCIHAGHVFYRTKYIGFTFGSGWVLFLFRLQCYTIEWKWKATPTTTKYKTSSW